MSDRPPRDDEDLEELLSELESTLGNLRSELDERSNGRRTRRRASDPGAWGRDTSDRRELPRPPSVGELLRFTNDYTIPTVIATLQATIEALELFRRFLELSAGTNRDRDRVSSGDRSALGPVLSGAGERAASDVNDALSRLRTTLAEADLPEDETSRDVIEDARDLSARIEEHIADSRETVSRERDRERAEDADTDGAVVIDVTDDEDEPDPTDTDAGRGSGNDDRAEREAGDDDEPQVDVESELDSIKRQMGKAEPPDEEGNSPEEDETGEDGTSPDES